MQQRPEGIDRRRPIGAMAFVDYDDSPGGQRSTNRRISYQLAPNMSNVRHQHVILSKSQCDDVDDIK